MTVSPKLKFDSVPHTKETVTGEFVAGLEWWYTHE